MQGCRRGRAPCPAGSALPEAARAAVGLLCPPGMCFWVVLSFVALSFVFPSSRSGKEREVSQPAPLSCHLSQHLHEISA